MTERTYSYPLCDRGKPFPAEPTTKKKKSRFSPEEKQAKKQRDAEHGRDE